MTSPQNLYQAGIPPRQINSLNYVGTPLSTVPVVNVPRAPTVNDGQFPLFTLWRNSDPTATLPDAEGDLWYFAKVNTTVYPVQYVWNKIATGTTPGGTMIGLTDTASTAVLPNGAGFIQLLAGAGVTVTSDPANNRLTIALSGGGSAIDQITTDSGIVTPDGTGNVNLFGQNVAGSGIQTSGAGSTASHRMISPYSLGDFTFDGGDLRVQSANVAGDRFAIIYNTDASDPSSDAYVEARARTGNPFFKVALNASRSYAYGIDQSDSNKLKIRSSNTNVARPDFGTELMTIDPTGATVAFPIATWTQDGVLYAASGNIISSTSAGVAGQVLTSNGPGVAPTYQFDTDGTAIGVSNIGMSYSAGTFTVCSADGTALSASNPGYVTLQSKTAGLLKIVTVTANQTFTDGSAGQIDNMRWGVSTGVNWANDMPFYLYAILNDAENAVAFAISRIPNRVTSPVAAGIGKAGAVVNTGQGDMFSLANITVADYESNPCLCIGSFRMQFAGATDSYTVQALNSGDGIGNFNEQTQFTYPASQNGNATGSYFLANGGTAPIWADQASAYYIDRFGRISWIFSSDGINVTTDGVGAVALRAAMPLGYYGNSIGDNLAFYGGTTNFNTCYVANPTPGSAVIAQIKANQTGSNVVIFNQDVTAAGATEMAIKFSYIADITT